MEIVAVLLVAFACCRPVSGEDGPVEAPKPPAHPALAILRVEIKSLTDRAEELALEARDAAGRAAPAEAAVANADREKSEADRAAQAAAAALGQAKQSRAAAEKALDQARAALKAAEAAATKANAELAGAQQQQKAATAAQKAAEEILAKRAGALKPLAEARTAAEKAAAAARVRAELAVRKLAEFSRSAPAPDPKSMRLIETFKHDRPVMSCRIDPSGRFLLAGSQAADLQRWDLLTGSNTPLTGHRSWVRQFDLRADSSLLVSGDYSGRLIWWNASEPTPEPLRALDAHEGYARAVTFSPNGRYVATGGNDNLVKIWSAETGDLVAELSGHERHVYNVRFHPDGRHLVSGDLMGVLKQWEVETWKHVRDLDAGVLTKYDNTFKADCGGIRAMDFSPDGRLLAVGGIGEVTNAFAGVGKPTVVLFDWETGERLKVMQPAQNFQGTVWGLQFHPSGEFLLAVGGGSSGAAWFFRPDSEKSFFDLKLPQVAYDVCFHPDQLRLAIGLYDKTVRIYDLGPEIEPAGGMDKTASR